MVKAFFTHTLYIRAAIALTSKRICKYLYSPKPSLLTDAKHTEISCTGPFNVCYINARFRGRYVKKGIENYHLCQPIKYYDLLKFYFDIMDGLYHYE